MTHGRTLVAGEDEAGGRAGKVVWAGEDHQDSRRRKRSMQ